MSTLDRITEEILAQANAQADKILTAANRKAAEILAKGKSEREERERLLREASEQEYRDIARRAESAGRQARRRALLQARNLAVDEAVGEAKANILALPDGTYFDLLFGLFRKNAQPRDGVVRFAPADRARLPGDFVGRCGQVFPECALTLGEDMCGIANGFVVEYGDILQNCSIDGIFESEGQALRDAAWQALTTDA